MSRRASFWAGVRDISPLAPAAFAFGLVAGGAVTQAGFGVLESVGLSAGIYGAAAQLAATQLFDEGAPMLVVIGTALVINARFVIYSASMAPILDPRTLRQAAGYGYLLRDGAYALTMTRAVPVERVQTLPYYLGAATTDWGMWIAATTLGAFGAAFVPEGLGLEFIVPLVFVALAAGAMHDRTDVETAAVTAVAAAVLVPLLPLQTGLLASIGIGVAWAFFRDPDESDGEEVIEP